MYASARLSSGNDRTSAHQEWYTVQALPLPFLTAHR